MTAITALRISESGHLALTTIERIPGSNEYADSAGNILSDTGRTQELIGWGELNGTAHILRNEWGIDAYYIGGTP